MNSDNITDKRKVALWFGKPIDTFYNIDNTQWSSIYGDYLRELEDMAMNVKAVEEFNGVRRGTYNILPCTRWRLEYLKWKNRDENEQ